MCPLIRQNWAVAPLFLLLASAPAARGQCSTCPGDVFPNNVVDEMDVQPFVACLLAPGPGCGCADVDLNGQIEGLDISPFIAKVINGPTNCPSPVNYEPGPMETPPAAPCNESHCGSQPDGGIANSVYFARGEFHHTAVDLRIKGRGLDFVWARKYRSRFGPNTSIGNGWDFSYNIYLEQIGQDLLLYDGNSRQDRYILQPDGTWARDEFFREIRQNGDGTYTLTFADSGRWIFRPFGVPVAPGRLLQIIDRNGNALNFTYGSPAPGRLMSITDTLGRNISIAYNAEGHISEVTDFTGRKVVYSYYQASDAGGAAGDLKSVRSPIVNLVPPADHNNFPSGKTTTYTYSKGSLDDTLNHNLLTITDPKGQLWLTNTYHPTPNGPDFNNDRLTRQVWGNASDIIDVVYVPQTPSPANNNAVMRVIVNDRGTSTPPSTTPSASNVKEFFYDAANRLVMVHEYTGRAVANLPTTDATNRPTGQLRMSDPPKFESRWTYNSDSLPLVTLYPNGNSTENEYETDPDFGGPDAARRSRGNLRRKTRLPGLLGGDPPGILELFTYETGFGGCGCGTNFVKTHTDGRGHTTTHTYSLDGRGNRTRTDHRPGGGVEEWTYNGFGQILSHTWPANPDGHRRDDAFEYYVTGPERGYLAWIVVDMGGLNLVTQYLPDNLGRVTRHIDPRGNDTLMIYNDLDQIVFEQSREALPGIRYATKTWYDANDNVVRVDRENRDETGALQANPNLTTIYEYDILNRLVRRCDEKGFFELTSTVVTCADIEPFPDERTKTEYSYDPNGNQTQVRNPRVFAAVAPQPNDTVDTEYDERDLVFKSIRSKGDPSLISTTRTDYDGNANAVFVMKAEEDGYSRVTTHTYDGYNRLVHIMDPIGNVSTYSYDANNNRTVQAVFGERGGGAGSGLLAQTSYTYDAMDRLTQTDEAHFRVQTGMPIGDGLATATTSYGNNGQVESVTNDRGFSTLTSYDTANRRSLVTDALGNTTAFIYDANGNVTSTIELEKSDLDPGLGDRSFTTTFAYDALDRRTSTIDNIGNTVTQAYDSRGNLTGMVDARMTPSRTKYDSADRQISHTIDMDDMNPDGAGQDITVLTAQNDDSIVTGRTDDKSHTTAEVLNARNESVQTIYADPCVTATRIYDVHGNLNFETDTNGTTVNYTYDLLNRVISKAITPGSGIAGLPLGTTFETYSYDGLGRIVLASNNLSSVARTYDSLGNVLTDAQTLLGSPGPTQIVTCTYDGMGNKLMQSFQWRIVSMSYDALNRIKTISDNFTPLLAVYDYIGPSRVERLAFGNGVVCDYTYDGITNDPGDFGVRQIVRTRHYIPGAPDSVIDERTYKWDKNGNKIERKDVRSGGPEFLHAHTMDPADRLDETQVTSPFLGLMRHAKYVLDGVGNRDRVNTLGGSVSYDIGDYTLLPTCDNEADDEMNQYTTAPMGGRLYDDEGNLTAANTGTADECIMIYDYADRMVQCTATNSGQRHTYTYDALGRRIRRVVNTDAIGGPAITRRYWYDGWQDVAEGALAGGMIASYVYGPYIDELILCRSGGPSFYFHGDDLHNIMVRTDTSGAVIQRYEYDDYGRPVNPDTLAALATNPFPPIESPHLFQGRRYDWETGLYYYRTRYMDPRAGRFTTRDTIGIWGDENNSGNAYVLVANCPTTLIDPYGTNTADPCANKVREWKNAVRVKKSLEGPNAVASVLAAPAAPVLTAAMALLDAAGVNLNAGFDNPETACYELATCQRNAGYTQGHYWFETLGRARAWCYWQGNTTHYVEYGLGHATGAMQVPILPDWVRANAPTPPHTPAPTPPTTDSALRGGGRPPPTGDVRPSALPLDNRPPPSTSTPSTGRTIRLGDKDIFIDPTPGKKIKPDSK